ncbi:MAG: NTP transferase domain-containing protein, partial [Myxococcota bacterium]|nr:NTP transferase domain-containing protein [Myxococcota bacterium]
MNSAFLLAAGLGTRLRPLTELRPKALLPVCGVPMLDFALAQVRAHGHRGVLVNAHHLWQQVAEWAYQHEVQVQVELPEILGTGGGLRAALGPGSGGDGLADTVVVVNADILSDVDLTALAAACPEDGAAMALRVLAPGERIGAVMADAQGRVVHIQNVVEGDGGQPGTHFTGVHAMTRSAIGEIPDDGFQCVVRSAYRDLVPRRRVGAWRHGGLWIDVGTPASYLRANLEVLGGRVSVPLDPWTRGERGPGGSWVGPGAVIEGQVERCVIGAGAVVPGGVRLVDTVVWDGVVIPGSLAEEREQGGIKSA